MARVASSCNAFAIATFSSLENIVQLFSYVFIALMFFGWSLIPSAYVQSFYCKVASTASCCILIVNVTLGTQSLFICVILKLCWLSMSCHNCFTTEAYAGEGVMGVSEHPRPQLRSSLVFFTPRNNTGLFCAKL